MLRAKKARTEPGHRRRSTGLQEPIQWSIEVEFEEREPVDTRLMFRDDGRGRPIFSLDEMGSLGLRVVKTRAVDQLGGTVDIHDNKPTELRVTLRPDFE